MKSQGNYKLNDVLSTGILESGLPLSLQVIQIFNYLFFSAQKPACHQYIEESEGNTVL